MKWFIVIVLFLLSLLTHANQDVEDVVAFIQAARIGVEDVMEHYQVLFRSALTRNKGRAFFNLDIDYHELDYQGSILRTFVNSKADMWTVEDNYVAYHRASFNFRPKSAFDITNHVRQKNHVRGEVECLCPIPG
jgi:hypothetical protein